MNKVVDSRKSSRSQPIEGRTVRIKTIISSRHNRHVVFSRTKPVVGHHCDLHPAVKDKHLDAIDPTAEQRHRARDIDGHG